MQALSGLEIDVMVKLIGARSHLHKKVRLIFSRELPISLIAAVVL